MENIGDLFQRQSPIGHSTKQTGKTSSSSASTRTNSQSSTQPRICRFKERYPTGDRVKNAFAPKNWGRFTNNVASCVKEPSAWLNELDGVYGDEGLAKSIVSNNIRAIYRMSSTKDILNEEALDITAGLFVAKYGTTTPYALMIFFANYFTDYKTTMSAFELGDILRSFKEKFTPAWNNELERYDTWYQENKWHEQQSSGLSGKDALNQYVYESVKKLGGGEQGINTFIARSGMCTTGMMNRAEVIKHVKAYERLQETAF